MGIRAGGWHAIVNERGAIRVDEQDEALDPMHIGLFRADAQMTRPDSLTNALQERGWVSWRGHWTLLG